MDLGRSKEVESKGNTTPHLVRWSVLPKPSLVSLTLLSRRFRACEVVIEHENREKASRRVRDSIIKIGNHVGVDGPRQKGRGAEKGSC